MAAQIPWHDSLYAHHAVISHYPQRLDHVVSEFLDSRPWKLTLGRRVARPEDMSGPDLCKYNAIDCELTSKVWEKLKRDPAFISERHVYEHDLCLAELCAAMSRVGIRIDTKVQEELSTQLEEGAESLRMELCEIIGDPTFAPGKPNQVRKALFQTLGIKKLRLTPTGLPYIGRDLLETIRGLDTPAGRFADKLLRRREYIKIRSTYIEWPKHNAQFAIPGAKPGTLEADPDRAHYSWGAREKRDQKTKGGGHTVSGRLACRVQSFPRYNKANLPDRAREIMCAGPGRDWTYFDVSQGEPRVAAYLSGDPVRIGLCKGDVHAGNAKMMFPAAATRGWLDGDAKKDPLRGKPFRDLAKNSGLAIDYRATAETVHAYWLSHRFDFEGKELYAPPSLGTAKVIIIKIDLAYKVYVKFVNDNLERVHKCGFMRSPILGRIRWLGFYPSITDVANYPVQSCLADIMNLRSLALHRSPRFIDWAKRHPHITRRVGLEANPNKWPRLPKDTPLVIQVHDSCGYDTLKPNVPAVEHVLKDLWSREIDLPGGKLILPIDLKTGPRWSELG